MSVVARPHSFSAPQQVHVPPGSSLADIVTAVVGATGEAIVQLEGEIVPRERWRHIRPKDRANVVLTVPLHGGDNFLATLLSIVVVVVAGTVLGPMAASALNITSKFGVALTSGLVAAAGSALVTALFPIRPPSLGDDDRSPTYGISGARNDARPFSAVPVVLGDHRHTPPLASRSYTEVLGNEEYLRMLLVWGYGPLDIDDIRVGETPLDSFDDVEVITRSGYSTDSSTRLFPGQVIQEPVGVRLRTDADDWTTRFTEPNADEFSVDIVFPQGLLAIYRNGDRRTRTVIINLEWRLEGTATWSSPETIEVSDKTNSIIRRGIRKKVARGRYEVRMRRLEPLDDQERRLDQTVWTTLRTFRNVEPFDFRKPAAYTALRIKASDQLSGVIDNLNARVRSRVPVWNGSHWANTAISNNPAALYRHVLTGPANARPRTTAQINDAALGAWYTFCEQQGYTYNRIHDFQQSAWDTLADIASAGRAAPSLRDGVWSAIVDTPDKSVVQHFTPRNSWGFQATKAMPIQPHAWRVRFVNEDKEFAQDEMIVYDDGYSAVNATNFETIEFPGITDPDLIWKFGRYHIAQSRLRPEEYSFFADFEHLACTRGDAVRVSHDVTLWGDGWGRVKSVTLDGSGDVIGIVTDEELPVLSGESYNMRFRSEFGDSILVPVTADAGQQTEFTCDPVSDIQAGDLLMYGRTDRESVRLIVKRIERAQDLTARIVCVDESPEIYDADTGVIPPFESVITDPVDVTRFPPATPAILSVQSGTAALLRTNNGFLPQILVAIQAGEGQVPVRDWQVRYRDLESSVWSVRTSPFEQTTVALSPVETGEAYAVQVRSVSSFGVASAWSPAVTETVVGEDELPSDVTGFAVNIVGTEAHLSWEPTGDFDLSHYRIKWKPSKVSPTWDTATDLVLRASGTSASVPAQVGSYLIKAVDHAGNESENAAVIITSIAKLSGLNVVELVEEPNVSDEWLGTTDGVVLDATLGGLRLSGEIGSLTESGYYYVASNVDLLSTFTTRVTGNLTVSGQDLSVDLYDFIDLYEAGNLYGAPPGSFRAAIEVSTTTDDPSATPTWTDWERLVVGDYTARGYRFRVQLQGDGSSITPVLTAGEFEVDMPDRIIRFASAIASGGTRVAFDPAFYVFDSDKGLGITVLDGQEGDRYTITNLNKSGFDIAFTNGGTGVVRNISGIAQSYGELTT